MKNLKKVLILSALSMLVISCKSNDPDPDPIPVDPCASVTKDLTIVSDFECNQNYINGLAADADQQTGGIPVVDNPKKDGVNGSDKVGKYTDNGTDAWDNINIDYEKAIDLTKSTLKVKIYYDAENAGGKDNIPLKAKLEGTPDVKELDVDIDVKDAWKEYSFDFSEVKDKGNTKLILFFNAGQTDGTEKDVYYIDDVRWE